MLTQKYGFSFLYTRQSKEFKGKKFIYDTIRAKILKDEFSKETKHC